MALVSSKEPADERLTVDSCITSILPPSKDASATFGADMAIFNSSGQMEIQVEGLVVTSFANGRPEDDYELYLTTVYDLDPEAQIVAADSPFFVETTDILLRESCERVSRFYTSFMSPIEMSIRSPATPYSSVVGYDHSLGKFSTGANHWDTETTESLNNFIMSSPYYQTLDFVRLLGENLPDVLPAMMATIQAEAIQMQTFRSHFSRVIAQIAHRYPRMRVMTLTDPEAGLNEMLLAGLGESFASLHIGAEVEKNLFHRLPKSESLKQKISTATLDLEDGFEADAKQGLYDLVVVSTAIAEDRRFSQILSGLQKVMRAGAFLILVHASVNPIKDRLRRVTGSPVRVDHTLTPPEYPDMLDQCGFAKHQVNADQFFSPGISLIVRQKDSPKHLSLASLPKSGPKLVDHLLILGGRTPEVAELAAKLERTISPACHAITAIHDLDRVHESILSAASAVIVLADLDAPVMSSMTTARLDALRTVMAPEKVVLWLTRNSRHGNPEHAATFGFTRSIVAEVPSLRLQVLDLERLDCVGLVADAFVRLADGELSRSHDHKDMLWTFEHEIHFENGRRVVPRVLPWKPAIGRLNAARRVVVDEVNTSESCVELVPRQSPTGRVAYEALSTTLGATSVYRDDTALDAVGEESSVIRVECSTLRAVDINGDASYLILGRDVS